MQASAGRKPPNCPQLLAAAQAKVTAAGKALDAATAKMNSTLPALTEMVTMAHTNETNHDDAYNKAMAAYNEAITEQAKAVDQYNLDRDRLSNIKNECAQPVKPPNCAKLVADATKQLATDQVSRAQPYMLHRHAYRNKYLT